jgi:LysM repeat protein
MRIRPRRLTIAAAGIAVSLAGIGIPTLGDRVVANDRVVTVRPGQTLSGIALVEGVSVAQLIDLNDLVDPNRIFAGQRLVVARDAKPAAKAPTTITHRVAAGETLSGIAVRYGTSVAAIARANGIADPSYVRAGQVLAIPGAAASGAGSSAPAPAPAITHRVAAGETLSGIAVRYGTSVAAIARANGIADPSYVRAGQVLAIPGAAASASGSRMPATMAGLVSQRRAVGRIIEQEARRQGVPVALAEAVAWQESGWQAGVVSYAGAIGVMQLTPATADWVGSTMLGRRVNLWDASSNVEAGVTLLGHYLHRYGGSRSLALAAYYQGQTAADRHGVYAVTRPYIASILELEAIFSR